MKTIHNLPVCPIIMGLDEEVDEFNFFLFSGHQLGLDPPAKVDGLVVRRSSKPLYYGGRLFRVVKIIPRDEKPPFCVPFYCSTGSATPERSPRGTFWPTDGVYPAMVSWTGSEWIGKFFWSFECHDWMAHDKIKENLPGRLQEICSWLEAMETEN